MSVAEKLTTIAENEQKVFDAGKTKEWNDFWDIYQNYGAAGSYSNKFFNWNGAIYKPKYPIIVGENFSSQNCFAHAYNISDTLVDITFMAGCDVSYFFQRCSNLETVRKITCAKTANLANMFYQCKALKNVTFDGEIGTGFSVSASSDITHDSLMSIINHLYDYKGNGDTTTRTMTIGSANLGKLTDAEKAIATEKGWSLV